MIKHLCLFLTLCCACLPHSLIMCFTVLSLTPPNQHLSLFCSSCSNCSRSCSSSSFCSSCSSSSFCSSCSSIFCCSCSSNSSFCSSCSCRSIFVVVVVVVVFLLAWNILFCYDYAFMPFLPLCCACLPHSLIMCFTVLSLTPLNQHLSLFFPLSFFVLIPLTFFFFAVIKRVSVFLIKFPILSHINIISCTIFFVCRLNYLYSWFSFQVL